MNFWLVRLGELEPKIAAKKGRELATWFAAAATLIILAVLFTTVIGLNSSSGTALAMLKLNGFILGPLFLLVVYFGVGTVDIIQHLAPERFKGGEIETTKWVKTAAAIMAADIAILVFSSFVEVSQSVKLLGIGFITFLVYNSVTKAKVLGGDKK